MAPENSSRDGRPPLSGNAGGGPDRLPYAFGSSRHIDMANAELRQCIDKRVHHRWQGAGAPRLATAFRPERIGCRGHWMAGADKLRSIVSPRHRVIHIRARQQLSVLVVDGALAQRLADPLDDAAG